MALIDTSGVEPQTTAYQPEWETSGFEKGLSHPTKRPSPNLLRRTRCYLIGAMENENGEQWRTVVKTRLSPRGIKFFDPYYKPFVHDIPEDELSRQEMLHWRETGQFDLVASRMKAVRGYDLRLCDISDWFVAVIKPKLASWGSAEEITTAIREKKPVFLVIDDPKGIKACPLWLFGVMPYKYFYNNIYEAMDMIEEIDDGKVRMSSDRWKLLSDDYR